MAGYGAIVIKGASEKPVYISIRDDKVYFHDATTLWGLGNVVTGRVVREQEPGAGLRTIMRIGPAGEKMVPYANVMTETYRHFGRIGLGAVFGSKGLKAIVISGKRSLPVADRRAYRHAYDDIHSKAVHSPLMKKYHDLGTAVNILPLNTIGGLPTRNLQSGRLEGAEAISGEAFAEGYLGRRLACAHCPVGCIHIAALREPYESEPYFYRTRMVPYDYEPIFSLGSMLGITNPETILRLLERVDDLGLDCMSAGVVLAWATEALEKGLVTTEDTCGLDLQWGGDDVFLKAIDLLVSQPNSFYAALSKGVDYAASIYGGAEFAMAYGHNEIPGYHTGPAAHLGFMLGARHSHLDNGGYGVDQKTLSRQYVEPEALVDMLIKEEAWRQILSSLVVCFFARGIYDAQTVLNSLETIGVHLTEERLLNTGRAIWRRKYAFKVREGFTIDKGRIPQRIYKTTSALGDIDPNYMERALAYADQQIRKAVS